MVEIVGLVEMLDIELIGRMKIEIEMDEIEGIIGISIVPLRRGRVVS